MKNPILIAGVLAATLTLAGCSTPASDPTTAPSTVTSTEPSQAPAAETPSEEPSQPEDDGTAQFGETYTWEDGISVSVEDAGKYRPSGSAATGGKGPYRKYKITIKNETGESYDPNLANVSLSSDGVEGEQVFDSAKGVGGAPSTKIRDGKSVSYSVVFNVANNDDVTLEFAPDYSHDSVLYAK